MTGVEAGPVDTNMTDSEKICITQEGLKANVDGYIFLLKFYYTYIRFMMLVYVHFRCISKSN